MMHIPKRLFIFFNNELFRLRHERVLNSMTEMEQFRHYTLKVQPQEFFQYQKKSPQKRLEFQSVVNELGLNLKGSRVLDIGPGYGDSLDICYEKGAERIEFIEIDQFFFTYNRLKAFTKGYRINHMTGLSKLESGKFDLIWIKGSVSADLFIAKGKFRKDLSLSHWSTQLESLVSSPLLIICPPLSRWLVQLESLASPTCEIIICPHWLNDGHECKCKDVHHNLFTDTMLSRGYVILPKIRHHNYEPEYPITFYKNMARTSHNK
jgi:hypothetical protein